MAKQHKKENGINIEEEEQTGNVDCNERKRKGRTLNIKTNVFHYLYGTERKRMPPLHNTCMHHISSNRMNRLHLE